MSRWHGWAVVPVVVGLAGTLLLAACGDGDSVETRGPSPSRPTGADEVVVQVLVAGGFVPVEMAVTAVPTLTVLGDGTVITPAPVTAIYPGPAITPLQAATADGRTVDDLVRRADDLGLLAGPLEFGRPSVADAPETTVTITAGGETHRHTAYALGISDDRIAGGQPGLSEEEAANRQRLRDFLAATEELPPGERPWRPSAIAVFHLGAYRPDPDLPQLQMVWPLPDEPATTNGNFPCTRFEGQDADVLLDALARANARTPWLVGGSLRSLAFRPVVPGQPGCPTG